MPRKKVLCAGGCGKLVEPGTGSGGQVTCRLCRRDRAMRLCDQCGQEFRSVQVGAGRTRFCSQKCFIDSIRLYDDPRAASKASSRARKLRHAETWDGVTDRQIYERDGWACQIPGCDLGPIRADLKYPEPLSPEPDHIVPISLGGADTQGNKRAAHRACNQRRGNRMRPDDVPVITVELAPLGLLPGRERAKVVHLCAACQDAPVKSEGATCRSCYLSARAAARDVMQARALALRDRDMGWQQISEILGLSGPGAARNVAYPPWKKYAG